MSNHSLLLLSLVQDPGLLQSILDGLYAAEVWRFSHACRGALQSLCSDGCLCCPHIYPGRGTTLCSALRGCQLQHLKRIRPMTELDSDPFLDELIQSLPQCSSLEELGPIGIDESGGPFGPESQSVSLVNVAETSCMFTNASMLPALGRAFEQLRSLRRLTLTLRCIHDANEMGSLVFSIGACEELQELRLDLDTTLACGGEMVAAVAKMLHRLGKGKAPKLAALSLGYSWFSDASDDTLLDLRDAIAVLPLKFIGLLGPQDPEFGSLESACGAVLSARTLEEVLVMDGWDHDGMALPTFLEALCNCPNLKRLHMIGDVPDDFDLENFQRTLKVRLGGEPEVCVNCPLGLKIASRTLGS